MSANREKVSNTMGIVFSLLLHGIFFAGCLAIDATSVSAGPTKEASEISTADTSGSHADNHHQTEKAKS